MWETVKLGDVLNIQNGYAFDSKQFDESGAIGLIRIRDLKNGKHTQTRYSGSYESKYVVRSGDLLIGMDGEFRCYEWKGEDALLNQRVCRLQDFHDSVEKRFILYVIDDELKKVEEVTGFTTVKHLSSKILKELPIPLPPLAEQKRIVERLDKAFAEIDKAIATAEAKEGEVERLKAATLSAMLNRGPESGESITGDEEDSVMWQTVRLGDVCQIVNGSTPLRKEPKYWDNGTVPWFTIDDLRVQGKDISSTIQSVTENAVEEKKVKLIPPDSVLLCCTASIGEAAIARVTMATNQQFNALIPRVNGLYADFLYYVVKTLKNELLGVSGSTTINFISIGKLKDIKISLPPLAEQKRIVERLDKAFAEIEIIGGKTQSCVENYSALKASILKQELTPSEAV